MNTLAIEKAQQAIKDGEKDKARRILAEVLLNDPRDEQVWLLLSYVVPGEKAIESLERVLKINPGNQEAMNRLNDLIPVFVPPTPTPLVNETEIIQSEAVEQSIEKQTQQNVFSQPMGLSEDEFEELFSQSQKVGTEEDQELVKLSVSQQELNKFFQQTDQKPQSAFTSLGVSGESIDAIISQPNTTNLSEKGGETLSPSLGIQFPQIPSGEETPVSLEVSDEEIESLLRRLEGESQVEAKTPGQEMALGSDEEVLLPQTESISASDETVAPQLDGTFISPEQAVEGQPATALISLEQPLTEKEQQSVSQQQLTEQSTQMPAPRKKDRVLRPSATPKKSKGIAKWVLVVVMLPIIAFILVVGGFAWYYYYGPCGIQRVNDSTQQLLDIQKRWDNSLILATNSSRIVLTEPLVRLDDIRQELINIPVPACMQGAKGNLQNSMQATIEAYISFLQYVSENDIRQKFYIAAKEMGEYVRKMQEIHNCAPFCSTFD